MGMMSCLGLPPVSSYGWGEHRCCQRISLGGSLHAKSTSTRTERMRGTLTQKATNWYLSLTNPATQSCTLPTATSMRQFPVWLQHYGHSPHPSVKTTTISYLSSYRCWLSVGAEWICPLFSGQQYHQATRAKSEYFLSYIVNMYHSYVLGYNALSVAQITTLFVVSCRHPRTCNGALCVCNVLCV